jgi:hypothetical protein
MPSSRTSAQIITKARELADQTQYLTTGDAFVPDAEALGRVNDALAALWEMMLTRDAEALLTRRVSLSAPGDADEPDFPTDFYKLVGFWVLDGGHYRRLTRLPEDEIDDYSYDPARIDTPRHYLLRSAGTTGLYTNIIRPQLFPSPGSVARTYRLDYVPDAPLFDNDSDPPADSIELPNHWWRWIEYETAIGLLIKEESDPSGLMSQQQKAEGLILRSMTDMDYSEPRRIKDVRGITARARFNRDLERWRRERW